MLVLATIQVGNRIEINKDGIIARNQANTAETFRLNANTGEVDIRSGRIRGSVTIGDSDTTMQDVLDGAIGGLDEEDVIRVIQDTWGHVDNRTEIDGGHIRARTISAAAIGAGTIILNQGPTQEEQLDIRTSPSLSDGVFMNSTGVVAKKNNIIQSGFDVDGKWFAGGNLGPGGQQTYAIEADRDGFRAYSDSGDEIFIIDLSPTSATRNKVIVYGELRATKLVLPVR